ncbi:MAG TPA: DUF4382 domain-containing protein [Candidatus Angelobacter sp.]|nr:DUF4382 domain-containing protein [Candidatus Angelobacter sp.]
MQDRPQNFLPSMGTVQISMARDPSTSDPLGVSCRGHSGQVQNLTSLVVEISSVQVHRTGALNLLGGWLNVSDTPKTVDLLQLKSLTQLGSISVSEGVINLVRLTVSSTATAGTSTVSVSVTVSSSHLDAKVNSQVTSGKITSITLEIVQPHVVCQGNGDFRLTPELTASSKTSD